MIATRGAWQRRRSDGWARQDSDGHRAAVVLSSDPTHRFLWALYPCDRIGPPVRAGYSKNLDDAMHAANEAMAQALGARGYAEGEP